MIDITTLPLHIVKALIEFYEAAETLTMDEIAILDDLRAIAE